MRRFHHRSEEEREEIDDGGELLAEPVPAPLSGVSREGVPVVEAMVCQITGTCNPRVQPDKGRYFVSPREGIEEEARAEEESCTGVVNKEVIR